MQRSTVRRSPSTESWHRGLAAACSTLALFAVTRAPASAESLSLTQAVERARAQNPEIRAAEQALGVARARLQRARYWNPFNPEIEGGAAARNFADGGSATQRSGGLSLEIEVAGQRGLRIEEAARNLNRVGAEVDDVVRLVRALVTAAYYQALYRRQRLELAREVERLNHRLREATAVQLRAGEVSKLEANLAVVRHSQARKDALLAARDDQNALRELERLMGDEPTGTVALAGDLHASPIPLHEDDLLNVALRIRPDLRAREAEIERLDADAKLTRRLIVPNPTLRGTYEEETESSRDRDRIIGGTISIPIPVFDRQQAEMSAVAAVHAQAVHERSGTLLQVKREVRDAFRGYEAAPAAIELFETDALTPIAENFRFVESAYRAGKMNLIELITVQNDLVNARLSYLDSQRDYWLARAELERAVGQPLAVVVDR
jgi:cobalt-zinc-cadmium efflux system outer membrane protein